MKPTSNFKMTKKTKALLSLMKFKTVEYHTDWKKSMINAELAAAVRVSNKDDKK